MHLKGKFNVSLPMCDREPLENLHSILNELEPDWSAKLNATRDEEVPGVFVGRDGDLFQAFQVVNPSRSYLNFTVFAGGYKHLLFFLMHDRSTEDPDSNQLSFEAYQLSTIAGQLPPIWARRFFDTIVRRFPVSNAKVYIAKEFDAKNMVTDAGCYSITPALREALPGLYWLNYFGPPYIDLIGRERLLSAPAFEVKPIGDGIFLSLDESPSNWQTARYQERERRVIDHLGKQFFFERHDPERKLVAPDFKALYAREQKHA